MAKLSTSDSIDAVTITSSSGLAWAYGTNAEGLNNAAFSRHGDDPSLGDLLIDPLADLAGQTLTATIAYHGGKTDRATVVAGRSKAWEPPEPKQVAV